MLHKHLLNIKCPVCKSREKWNSEGSSNEYHLTDGIISCNNNHKWIIKQELLRLDNENSDEEIIYHEREMTGYPKEVNESERIEFLEFLAVYFKKLVFSRDTVVVYGEPILFYRFFNKIEITIITVNKNEKLLRQLHETIVRKRLHNTHSFIRTDIVNVSSANQFYIFKNKNGTNLDSGDILVQFTSNQNEKN